MRYLTRLYDCMISRSQIRRYSGAGGIHKTHEMTMPKQRIFPFIILFAFISNSGAAEFNLPPESWVSVKDSYGVYSFKGIPFAAPPVGENRWRPPRVYQPKKRRHIADKFPAACMQGPHIENWYRSLVKSLGEDPDIIEGPEGGYSEDCLYLNIWSASPDSKTRLPVMVWIHGGSNKGGWSYEPNYHGHVLARHDVVVVSIPYRLGIFGYFSHPALIREQSGKAGNYGLLDLITALEWIRTHIGEFGGDPNNVTIFGESAGAANVAYLMASNASVGLFHKAIHQSAGYQQHQTGTLSELTKTGAELSRILGIADIESLRALTAENLLAIVEKHLSELEYGSVAGGHALDAKPFETFLSGKQASVPMIIGTNANEWLMYVGDSSVEDYLKSYQLTEHQAEVEALLSNEDTNHKLDRIGTAYEMLCPSLEMAVNVSAGQRPAYVYQLTRVREGSPWQAVGAYHGAEIPYVFNTHDTWLATNEVDHELTAQIQQYWLNFAKTGNPNDNGLPAWGAFDVNDPRVIDLGDEVSMKAAPDVALCRLMGY